MRFLQLSLLVILLPGCDNKDGFQEPISFKIIRIHTFYSRSWVQTLGSIWVDELQTHKWDSNSGNYIFLWPWSKGNFSNEEWIEQEKLCSTFSIQLIRAFQNRASQWQLEYPFEVQTTAGYELRFGETSVGFIRVAYQGSDFISFQNTSWLPSPQGGSRAQDACRLFNLNQVGLEIADRFLSDTCPRLLLGILDAGKADLQRQDGTWYLRKSLDVEAIEAAGLSCRVRHSSLGGQDIILSWENDSSMGLIFAAVIVSLVLLTGLAFWLRKRRKPCATPRTPLPSQ
ncbi:T-cell surface glycoprotein CD1a-like isoform X2 [Equus quagga]|uniref:T-cell surface glycoprotein CD1a-like isoform X2 n=1 Tax=Equus quagga TaxID=89248 RepID=UPI001EE34619|nr:T-cell surface glycoprotein CD1a-like isoform X2 [Equus quagga]